MRTLFRFPDVVNETSARLVAAGVVIQGLAFLVLRDGWVLVPLTYGFLARVSTGPTLSPLGRFVTRFATPRVEAAVASRRGIDPGSVSRQVPGAPKRFAQGIGLAFTALASAAWAADLRSVGIVLIVGLVLAATLESVFALCLGCIAYSAIWGCADCDDISDRLRQALAESQREAASPAVTRAGSSPAVTRAGSSPAMHRSRG